VFVWLSLQCFVVAVVIPESRLMPLVLSRRSLSGLGLWAYYNCDTSTIRLRFDYDLSTIQHPTRSYVLSSNNEHVNSFPLL